MNGLRNKRYVVIGAGNIGRILIGRLQLSGVPSRQIRICDSNPEHLTAVSTVFGVKPAALNEMAVAADILLLAVPPKATIEILQAICHRLVPSQIVISFAAAVSLQRVESLVPEGVAVARVMPNAPSMVGAGMNPVAYGTAVGQEAKALVEELLAMLGQFIEVRDEQMNWCVGLSGAAIRSLLPALEGLILAGIEAGFSPGSVRQIAAQTMLGTAALVQKTTLPIEAIKALTPMETVNEEEMSRIFFAAVRETRDRVDRLKEKLSTSYQ